MIARIILPFLAAAFLIASGCAQQQSNSPAQSQPAEEVTEVTVTPEMTEILAKADALDGQTDQVVTRCASCALGMDGSEQHALHVGDYTMQFCADHCKESFSKDTAASILAMQQHLDKQ